MIMEADKSQNLMSAGWRLRRTDGRVLVQKLAGSKYRKS